jgi:hypothetical protein
MSDIRPCEHPHLWLQIVLPKRWYKCDRCGQTFEYPAVPSPEPMKVTVESGGKEVTPENCPNCAEARKFGYGRCSEHPPPESIMEFSDEYAKGMRAMFCDICRERGMYDDDRQPDAVKGRIRCKNKHEFVAETGEWKLAGGQVDATPGC